MGPFNDLPPGFMDRNLYDVTYLRFRAQWPFEDSYLGLDNPYDNTVVRSQSDYYRYLREKAFHCACESFYSSQIVQLSDDNDFLHTKKEELHAQLAEKSSALSESLTQINALSKKITQLQDTLHSRTVVLSLALLIVFTLAFVLGRCTSPDYDAGFAAGYDPCARCNP